MVLYIHYLDNYKMSLEIQVKFMLREGYYKWKEVLNNK